ncbi:MAG: TetR/AcrR family transcriptional regulator, partial [Bdellovibrio sp.]|nr:TetR/AcrR family transcriptional regulator [Bdellovibrio sp.]
MRISKEQRQKNIEAVFKSVIKLSSRSDFDSLTMKAIAKEAKIGEATIYNYFPKKESLLTGYLD